VKLGFSCLPEGNLKHLYDLSHFVAEIANLSPNEHLPYVGASSFAHKGGIHVAAMRRNIESYQHVDPLLVGNRMRTVVSELSGKGNLLSKADEYNIKVKDKKQLSGLLEQIKDLESRGFSFESAEASITLMMQRLEEGYAPPFEMIDYSAMVENRKGRGIFSEAMVKVKVNGEIFHTIAEGNGPVNALDAALRKGLIPIYPKIAEFKLMDYKVRIIDGSDGTAAITRVLIDTQNGHRHWSTVGASTNIIEASWIALADSIEYGLWVT
jgi:2-isopropylmalate synthase